MDERPPRRDRSTETRYRNNSIKLRTSVAVALAVALLTSYVLIFPARTVERELLCTQKEHVHDESCWLTVLSCVLGEDETHVHDADCYKTVLICGLEEHVHTDECYAAPEPIPVQTGPPEPEATDGLNPVTEPLDDGLDDGLDDLPWEEIDFLLPEPTDPPPTEPDAQEEPLPVLPPSPDEGGDADPPEQGENEGGGPLWTTIPPDPVWNARPDGTIEFPADGIDLAPYLFSVIFQRQDGSALVEDTVFENGDTVKANIIYDIPKDVVTLQSKYVYYQLPEGIRPIEEANGEVMDDDEAVGVYTITEDGVIHILFKDDFANGNAIMGTVSFFCVLSANDDGTDRLVEFENDAGSILITVPDEQRYDLTLDKTGALQTDYSRADFVLTLSSEKGTGAPIDLTDALTNQTPATLLAVAYDQGGFEIWRVGSDGSRQRLTEPPVHMDPGGMWFQIEGLPALEAGERYEVCYSVDLTPDLTGGFELDNEAVAKAGRLEARTTFFVSYACDVTKSGAFNSTTGLIDWVITVNPESRPVGGWRLEDDLPYPIVGKALLTNANGVTYADLTPADGRTIRYTFPANAPAKPYFLRYSTASPVTSETVQNKVRLINERDITVTAEVTVDERTEGVDKTLGARRVQPDGTVKTLWSFVVDMPLGQLDEYSFRDNISTPVMDVNEGTYLDSNLHFSYAAALEEAFQGNLRLIAEGRTYRYGDPENDYVRFTLIYYDSQGQPVAADDATTHVSRVSFQLTPLKGGTFQGYEIVADDYPTWLDASSAEEGSYWSYQNFVYLHGGVYDVALAFHRVGNPFEKQLKLNGRFTSDDGWADYADTGGELEYRLLLDLTAMEGDSFTVTDVLPSGTALVPDSVRVFFTGANLYGEYNGIFAEPGHFTARQSAAPGGGTVLLLEGDGITETMKQTYAYAAVVYRVRLTDDIWNDYSHAVETLTNRAGWDGYTDSHTVTVENFPKRLQKTGVQLLDEEDNPLNRLRFTLLINAAAEDLNPEGDWLTLEDRFSSDISANLELNSVRLYHYDPNGPNGLGVRATPYEFYLSYDTATATLTAQLPDETAYVLIYDYTVDQTAILDGETTASNAVSLTGGWSSAAELVLRAVTSNATAWQRVITITKVDEQNYSRVLPGAEFTLECWDPARQLWVPSLDETGQTQVYVTNAAGQIVLTLLGTQSDIYSSSLYRMTEIRAPAGYEAGDAVLYFLCMPGTATDWQTVFDQAAYGSGVSMQETWLLGSNGGACIVTNPFSGLTVTKRWYNAQGADITDTRQDPVTVTLYQSTDPTGETGRTPVPEDDSVVNPVRLGPDNDWTYTWASLKVYDEEGNQLYFFVEEEPVPGFLTDYTGNGVAGGVIEITNQCEPYHLPATGSDGGRGLTERGFLLMTLAAGAYVLLRLRARKRLKE